MSDTIEYDDGTVETVDVIIDDAGESVVVVTPEFPNDYGESERVDFWFKGGIL